MINENFGTSPALVGQSKCPYNHAAQAEHRPGLPEAPARIRRLPVDERGYPIPFFVAYHDGAPDFRLADPEKVAICITDRKCWICGEHLGKYLAFVVGPMGVISHMAIEPPSHLDCAEYAVKACPFLVRPHMVRRDSGLPDEVVNPGGIAVAHNPGAMAIWVTGVYKPLRVKNGQMFRMGEPMSADSVMWWAEGREATDEDVRRALYKSLPKMIEFCGMETTPERRREALRLLAGDVQSALRYMPKGTIELTMPELFAQIRRNVESPSYTKV